MKIIYGLYDLEPDLITLSGSDFEYKKLKEQKACDNVFLNQDITIINNNNVFFSKSDTEKILYLIEGLVVESSPGHNYFTSEESGIDFLFSKNEYR